MAASRTFDIILKYEGRESRVYDVDPDRYNFYELLEDVFTSVLSHIPSTQSISATIQCDVPGSTVLRTIADDIDVLDMFYMPGRSREINVIVGMDMGPDVVLLEQLGGDDTGVSLSGGDKGGGQK